MKGQLQQLQQRHDIIGDVRGQGLMLGIDMVKDRNSKASPQAPAPLPAGPHKAGSGVGFFIPAPSRLGISAVVPVQLLRTRLQQPQIWILSAEAKQSQSVTDVALPDIDVALMRPFSCLHEGAMVRSESQSSSRS